MFLVRVTLLGLVVLSGSMFSLLAAEEKKIPISGTANAQFAPLDELMSRYLEKCPQIPGGVLAVAKDGKLVYERGFGYSDKDEKTVMKPDALFRISSVSKPITAVAILKLIEEGKLKLDAKVFDVLALRAPAKGFDPRWKKITIEMLLEQRAGWDHRANDDPFFLSPKVCKEMGVMNPAMPSTIIAWMLKQELHHDPGEKFGYSNFNYSLLGRVVEKVSKKPYEKYVQEAVLKPLGIERMRLGKTLIGQRAKDEVKYFSSAKGQAVMGAIIGKQTPGPYGPICVEALDASAGWIASGADLVRFACDLGNEEKSKILKPASIRSLFGKPAGVKTENYYAKGWTVEPASKDLKSFLHDGSLDGSSAFLFSRADGVTFALLFNSAEKVVVDKKEVSTIEAILPLMNRALSAVFAVKRSE
jgi:N-acyl-D-amino-acid deacylase